MNLTLHFFVNARKKYNNALTLWCTGKRGAPVLKNKFRLGGISQHLSPFRLSQAIGVGAWVFTKDNMFFFIKNSTMKGEALCEVAQCRGQNPGAVRKEIRDLNEDDYINVFPDLLFSSLIVLIE